MFENKECYYYYYYYYYSQYNLIDNPFYPSCEVCRNTASTSSLNVSRTIWINSFFSIFAKYIYQPQIMFLIL